MQGNCLAILLKVLGQVLGNCGAQASTAAQKLEAGEAK